MKIFISIFFIFFILSFLSKVKIIINQSEYENGKIKCDIKVGVYLIGFIKIFGFSINEKGVKFLFVFIPFSKMKIKKIDKKTFKDLRKLELAKKVKIEKLNFDLQIGLENVILLSYIITFLSTIISVISTQNMKQVNLKKYAYHIKPKYNSNDIYLKFSGEFSCYIFSLVYFFARCK